MPRTYYINLESRPDRRASIEQSFRLHGTPDRELVRIEAIDAKTIGSLPGGLSAPEVACFRSHVKALLRSLDDPGYAHIAEDDVLIGPRSFKTMDNVVGSLPPAEWDVLFCDVCVPMVPDMLQFFQLSRKCRKDGGVALVDVGEPLGATSYLVNERSKRKLLDLLGGSGGERRPYDAELRHLIREKHISGKIIVPFLTSVSPAGFLSSIQPDATAISDAVWHCFRLLVWLDADAEQVADILDAKLPRDFVAPEDTVLARILAARISEKFQIK